MNTDEKVFKVKEFFNQYKLKHLTEVGDVYTQISCFCANVHGETLERYLKECALQHDNDNLNKVYLVKNKKK